MTATTSAVQAILDAQAQSCAQSSCECRKAQRQGYGDTHCVCGQDTDPSMSVHGKNGKVLVYSQHGCDHDTVIGILKERGLWPERSENGHRAKQRGRILETYPYRAETGELLYESVRYEPKDFKQRRPYGKGGYIWNLDGVQRVLYRLPEIIAAVERGDTIYIPEGERDVGTFGAHGYEATCNVMGAGKWRDEYSEVLCGARVVIIQDKDEAGRRHAASVIASLKGKAASVRLVEAREGKDASDHFAAGYGIDDFIEIEIPQAPNGAVLLTDVERFIRRYSVLPSESAYPTVALWIAHTHALDRAESTPRLAALSPEPECGKTRLLEVFELLAPKPMFAFNATAASIYRKVADQDNRPTVFFDEIDTVFGGKAKEHEDLRALLNAGHRRGSVAYRCVGEGTKQEVKEFPAFAAVALAGIGDLPDTILSRAIVLNMRRRAPNEHVEPFRRRKAEADGHKLRDALSSWTAEAGELLSAIPEMPPGIVDRAADVWEPLLAIADAAGGDWPERARAACVELVNAKRDKEPSLGVRLLSDLRDLFTRTGEDGLWTATILTEMHNLDEAPWMNLRGKPLDARGLSRRLATYGVKSRNIHKGDAQGKGYAKADFIDVWARYLPSPTEAYQAYQMYGEPEGDDSRHENGAEFRTDKDGGTDTNVPESEMRTENEACGTAGTDRTHFQQGESEGAESREVFEL